MKTKMESTSALKIATPKWNMTELNGYEPKTTFWQDFCIADKAGIDAIKDTYERAKSEWKDSYKYWTELCLVLNHKIWQWLERNDQKARLYDRLWKEADEITAEWPHKQQQYYFKIMDLTNQLGN